MNLKRPTYDVKLRPIWIALVIAIGVALGCVSVVFGTMTMEERSKLTQRRVPSNSVNIPSTNSSVLRVQAGSVLFGIDATGWGEDQLLNVLNDGPDPVELLSDDAAARAIDRFCFPSGTLTLSAHTAVTLVRRHDHWAIPGTMEENCAWFGGRR